MSQNESDSPPPSAAAESPPAHPFSATILNIGFVFALVLAAACLTGSTFYLYSFFASTTQKIDGLLAKAGQPGVTEVLLQLGINAALVSARLALLSCGVFIGMAFGFLGFALFLIGIKGEIEASGTHESFSFKIARISPGAFVITCTMVLIGICVTHRTPFDYRYESPGAPPASGEKTAASILKKLAAADASAPAATPAPSQPATLPAPGATEPRPLPAASAPPAAPLRKHFGAPAAPAPARTPEDEAAPAERDGNRAEVWR